MIIPYYDEQIVDDNYQCHLTHIPCTPKGEKHAVPYVYTINDDDSLGAKYYCSSSLGEHGAFIRVGQTITFLQNDISPSTRVVAFYEYDNPDVKSQEYGWDMGSDESWIFASAEFITNALHTDNWCVQVNGKRYYNPLRTYDFENEKRDLIMLVLPSYKVVDENGGVVYSSGLEI